MLTPLESKWNELAERLEIPDGVRLKLTDTLGRLSIHDQATAEHSMRVGMMAVRIGEVRDLPLRPLFYGGSMHDRGKLHVSGERLRKITEWTDEDRLALSHHPVDGYEATLAEGMVVTAGLVVRHHTFQPNAYPQQLPPAPPYMTDSFGDCARTIAIADNYDASHRSNAAGNLTGDEIKAKVLNHNRDLTELIGELYEKDIFSTTRRAF